MNDIGAATSATATWSSANTWAARVANGGPLAEKDAINRIYHGYIEARAGSTVTIEGIPVATYDVYVYPMGVEGQVDGGFVRSVTLEDANGEAPPPPEGIGEWGMANKRLLPQRHLYPAEGSAS